MVIFLIGAVAFGLLAMFSNDANIKKFSFVAFIICTVLFLLLAVLAALGYTTIPLIPLHNP